MRLLVKPRQPKWVVVSVYIGRKPGLQGLTFPTKFTYYRRKFADIMANTLNKKIQYDKWPGRDFEFQVAPYQHDADALKEVS